MVVGDHSLRKVLLFVHGDTANTEVQDVMNQMEEDSEWYFSGGRAYVKGNFLKV